MSTFNKFFAKKISRRLLYFVLLFNLLSQHSYGQQQRQVDVVVCMDLSGSTNGLVENFRDKMWDVINQWQMFTPKPVVRIGIIGFSRYSFSDGSGYVKVISDLTDDYDKLSGELFKIKPYVESGVQFVGAALGSGIHEMTWSTRPGAVKMMYVMGNGMVNLGNYDLHKLYEEAKEQNIIVNTVYCVKSLKQLRQKELPGWQQIAANTGGECFEITIDKRMPLIRTQVDQTLLASINDSINTTFIPYGKTGMERLKAMLETDDNASTTYSGYFYSRLRYKLSEHYAAKRLTWDVVTYKENYPSSKLAAVRPTRSSTQGMEVNLEEVVNANLEKRLALIQKLKISCPSGEEDKIHESAGSDDFEVGNMLDRVFISTFYKQAIAAGFQQ